MDPTIRCIGVRWWHSTLTTLRDDGLPARATFSRLPLKPRAPTFEETTCIAMTYNRCPHPHRHPERRISCDVTQWLTWHLAWGHWGAMPNSTSLAEASVC